MEAGIIILPIIIILSIGVLVTIILLVSSKPAKDKKPIIVCDNCGVKLPFIPRFCPDCGVELRARIDPNFREIAENRGGNKTPVIAIILIIAGIILFLFLAAGFLLWSNAPSAAMPVPAPTVRVIQRNSPVEVIIDEATEDAGSAAPVDGSTEDPPEVSTE